MILTSFPFGEFRCGTSMRSVWKNAVAFVPYTHAAAWWDGLKMQNVHLRRFFSARF